MLLLSAVCCVLTVALFAGLHQRLGGWISLMMVPLAIMLGSLAPAAFFVASLLGVAGFIIPKSARQRVRWLAGTIATGFAFGMVWWHSQAEIDKLRELRTEYPIVSLSDRLAYEADSPGFVPPSAVNSPEQHSPVATPSGDDIDDRIAIAPTPLTLSPKVADNLTQFDADMKHAGQSSVFARLHSASYESFVRANGFGVMRMARVNRRWIEHELGEPEPVPQAFPLSELPELAESPADLEPEDAQVAAAPFLDTDTARASLSVLHHDGRNEFFDTDRFGFIESRQRAAGFQPHAFRQTVHPRAPGFQQSLQVARLELVSLLKLKTPRVYVSDYLPDMEQLQSAPTRELDAFEAAALSKLWAEQDIVVEEYPGEIRMLGALRAGTHCLKCHSVQRGDLLGAFSYRIHTPGQRPRKLLPEDRQTARRPDRRHRATVRLARVDRY